MCATAYLLAVLADGLQYTREMHPASTDPASNGARLRMASLVCPGICWSSHFSVLLKTRERMTFGEREPNPQSEDTLKRELQRGAPTPNLVPFQTS